MTTTNPYPPQPARLLGYGGMSTSGPQGLLGEFFDPAEMRRMAFFRGLQQAGVGLATGGTIGDALKGLSEGVNDGRDDYLQQSFLGYKLKQEQEDRAYQNEEREAKKAERAQWDAYVTTLPPDLQPAIRANPGLVDNYITANDPRFQTREAPKAPQMETIYDEQGRAQKVEWRNGQWLPVGGAKPDDSGIIIENADGTRTIIGGKGSAKMTEGDHRAKLLADQVVQQAPEIFAGFDALATPQNYAGSKVPGGSAIMSPEAQVAEDGLKNVVANWLYLTSGATATESEVERQFSMIRPSPLDAPERIAAKKARLEMIIEAMRIRGGGAQAQPQQSSPGGAVTTEDGIVIRRVR